MVDDAEAVAHAHLHGVGAARVRAHPHAARLRHLHRRRHLGVGHHGAMGAVLPLPRLPRDVELEEIDALPHEAPAHRADLVGAVGDPRERGRLDVREVQRVLVAEPARDGDLRAVGEIARAPGCARR